jgi:hypothetical protein
VIGLKNEAGLTAFQSRGLGLFEMFDIEKRGDAGVLPLGLDAEKADAEPVGGVVTAQEVPEELDVGLRLIVCELNRGA